ncbi:putative uridine kinase [Nocardia nova SH22a]|uniref:Putative uridine kinase n=2 Tax=Nocardia nova TaxID=37330 RepID=W5TBT5_9NOCA|nr:putative uridine kinase [Nocardia nova SH22a]
MTLRMTENSVVTPDDLAARVRAAADTTSARRYLLGITGPPGAGKSTLAARLAAALGGQAQVAGMDGFHHTGAVLRAAGALDRKGQPGTFDVDGFVERLTMLRDNGIRVPWPVYDRELHEPIPDAVVFGDHRIAIVEGNYLLLDSPGWSRVPGLLDAVWYLDAPESVLADRLLRRHLRGGKSPDRARAMVTGSDLPNARLIARTRERADLVLTATATGYLIEAVR